MRDIKVLRVYNLVNANGTKLQLWLGVLKNRLGDVCIANADKGYRWCFNGNKIPMPVRSGYWFNGFEESVMLDWLKGNGWYPRSCVFMDDSRCHVYELPSFDDIPYKGNDLDIRAGESALIRAVRLLWEDNCRRKAVALYRYCHECTTQEADKAVREIVDGQI